MRLSTRETRNFDIKCWLRESRVWQRDAVSQHFDWERCMIDSSCQHSKLRETVFDKIWLDEHWWGHKTKN